MVVPSPVYIVVTRGRPDFAGLCSKSVGVLPLKASGVCFVCMGKGFGWNDMNRLRLNAVCEILVPYLFVSGRFPVVEVERSQEISA